MQGIYAITNIMDGKATAYVGRSIDIERRWKEHRRDLRGGLHPNAHLQSAWKWNLPVRWLLRLPHHWLGFSQNPT